MTDIPDYIPMLVQGARTTPQEGGCIVQIANWLSDNELWTDKPICVHDYLAYEAIWINDMLDNEARRKLAFLAPRLTGTAIKDRVESARVTTYLAQWRVQNRKPVQVQCESMVTNGGGGFTIEFTPIVTIPDEDALIDWLSRLIDEYDRVTNRVSPPLLTEEQGLELRAVMCQ